MPCHLVPHQAVEVRVRHALRRGGEGHVAAYPPGQLPVDVCVAVTTASRRIVYCTVRLQGHWVVGPGGYEVDRRHDRRGPTRHWYLFTATGVNAFHESLATTDAECLL